MLFILINFCAFEVRRIVGHFNKIIILNLGENSCFWSPIKSLTSISRKLSMSGPKLLLLEKECHDVPKAFERYKTFYLRAEVSLSHTIWHLWSCSHHLSVEEFVCFIAFLPGPMKQINYATDKRHEWLLKC